MKIVIVGHRGTGKTSLLGRMSKMLSGPFFDLDQEVAKASEKPIAKLFEEGESYFRRWEWETFCRLTQGRSAFIISVGGGFPVDRIPSEITVWWVRRDTDKDGRIFLDRPRLEPDMDPLREYEKRRQEREINFQKRSNFVYTAPEGQDFGSKRFQEIENQILENQIFCGGIKTVSAGDLARNLPKAEYYELRDDLLTNNEIENFLKKCDAEKVLFSLRREKNLPHFIADSRCLVDIDIQLWGGQVEKSRLIISSHDGSADEMINGLSKFSNQCRYFKISPLVSSWQDLKKGHEWQQEDPEHRSFLPRSAKGRWAWYRLFQKSRQKLNFWRDGEGSAADQPTLFQWLASSEKVETFAAVLGSPVHHSFSPLFHLDYFWENSKSFFAVEIFPQEFKEALDFLTGLGLKAAAVTSPLKKQAFQFSQMRTQKAEDLEAVNTMVFVDKGWLGHNTDLSGFKQSLVFSSVQGPFVLWGGGGTMSMLKRTFPKMSCYSSRLGSPREHEQEVLSPSTLIWGAPNHPETKMPPSSWRPKQVIDLSYRENSLGRFYAMMTGAAYLSGLDFFRFQALEQRQFWSDYL